MKNTARKIKFMGVTTEINPLQNRDDLQLKAEKGLITPAAYHQVLMSTWQKMTKGEKEKEYCSI